MSTMAQVHALHARLAAHRNAVKNKLESAAGNTKMFAIVVGTATAAGIVKGKFGAFTLAGIPFEAVGAGGLLAGSALGAFGKNTDDAVAAAAGFGAALGNTMGVAVGAKMQTPAALKKLSGVSGVGALPQGSVTTTTELDELLNVAEQARAAV